MSEEHVSLIPDFFHELFARIIPGLVAIAAVIYWSGYDPKSAFKIELLVFVLLAAWTVGVILDIGVFSIARLVRLDTMLQQMDNPWETTRKLDPWSRAFVNKAFAQLVLFRAISEFALVSTLLCLAIRLFAVPNSFLPVLHNQNGLYIVLCSFFTFVFGLCWWTQREGLLHWMEKHKTPSDFAI